MKQVPLRVEILNAEVIKNHNPRLMAYAKQCYSKGFAPDLVGRMTIDECNKFVLDNMAHEGILEHAYVTYAIEGIGRDQSHQEVRHRHASYLQQSQRYVEASDMEYVVNDVIAGVPEAARILEKHILDSQAAYANLRGALAKAGVPKDKLNENARAVLPNAAETKIVFTRNYRDLKHLFEVRCCNRAQQPIRKAANELLRQLRELSPIFQRMGAYCDTHGYCPESKKFSCGKKPTLNEVLSGYQSNNWLNHKEG